MKKFPRAVPFFLSLVMLFSLSAGAANIHDSDAMRGVWVSSVYNLDYPSSQTTDPAVREKYGKLAGSVGILANLLLCGMKIFE